MKNLILVISAILISVSVYAQSDSTNYKMVPSNINKTNDGMNRTPNNNINNNQNQDGNNPYDQNGTMNKDTNMDNHIHQETKENRDSKMPQNKVKSHPDGYMLQNGKMIMVKDGAMKMMEKDVTLKNGTIIMSNGYFMKKDGTKMMMKEGQHIDLFGKMIPMKSKTH